jgi:hypothetical protein
MIASFFLAVISPSVGDWPVHNALAESWWCVTATYVEVRTFRRYFRVSFQMLQ